MSSKSERTLTPAIYSWVMPDVIGVANAHGYTIAVHGSMARDFDLIAVPWTEEAVSARKLIRAILAMLKEKYGGGHIPNRDNPSKRPHGRLSWSVHFGHGPLYLDISVVPRRRKKVAKTG